MAGKRKATHWAARRKQKQARAADGEHRKAETLDRRAGLADAIHPGSYAALRPPAAAKTDEAAANDNEDDPKAPPKRRYGIWLANEGVKTIEAEVERALFEAGGISAANYGFLQKVGWSRAARTDKGVHAAGQMLTAKLQVGDDVPAFVAKVNAALPADIRVLHMVTVTKNFNAKKACDQRTYEYLAPTFIFGPRARAASSSSSGADADADIEITAETLAQHQAFRLDEATRAQLNAVLRQFEGTHNFHNFTSKLEPTSPKCNRYITSFAAADPPFVANHMEWIRLRVVGQSFLLHHIRKMIGTAVEVVAGAADAGVVQRAMQLGKMDLPKAPSVGLYLAQAHFKIYNLKLRDAVQATHPPLDLEEPAVKAAVEAFKRDFIFDHIIQHEAATRTYAKWLRTLEQLPCDYAVKTYDEWKTEKEGLAAITDRAAKRGALQALRDAAATATAATGASAEGDAGATADETKAEAVEPVKDEGGEE
ncbi:hypothetical protein PybrP1_002148 [[Pythium] brassicae (nom. inval.)]|nr:hypothetical protein PybrP1_002148 [[Pythium] brassicae (nom. inval.)]